MGLTARSGGFIYPQLGNTLPSKVIPHSPARSLLTSRITLRAPEVPLVSMCVIAPVESLPITPRALSWLSAAHC